MDTTQLERYLENMGMNYLVTSSDRLPWAIERPTALIANTDRADEPGTHWVCFYFPKKGPPEFFDSLGRSPEHYHKNFRNLLIAHGPEYIRNMGQVQANQSPYCGEYCLFFLSKRKAGETYRNSLTGLVAMKPPTTVAYWAGCTSTVS